MNTLKGGEGGIRTRGRGFPRQPLSRRPQSTTLAPPQNRNIINVQDGGVEATIQAEGEGFEPPVGSSPTAVFKTAALVHSAIPPVVAG